jgi:hypothetical protein
MLLRLIHASSSSRSLCAALRFFSVHGDHDVKWNAFTNVPILSGLKNSSSNMLLFFKSEILQITYK